MASIETGVFLPGQTAQATIRVRNTGNVPATFIVEVTQGIRPIIGPFISEGPPIRIITPVIPPGADTAVRVPVKFSEIEGPKDLQVRFGQAGPTGGFLNVLDSRVFSDIARVVAPAALPMPDEIVAPLPADAAILFSEGLGQPRVSFDRSIVAPGDIIRGQLTVPNTGGVPFTPVLEVNIAQIGIFPPFAVEEIRTIVPPRSLSLGPNQSIVEPLTINTAGLPVPDVGEITYDLRVVLLDTTTGILLLDGRLQDVFTIVVPAGAPPPLPPGPEEEEGIPTEPVPGPIPQPGFGDLTAVARFEPAVVPFAETTRLTVAIFNLQNFDITADISVDLLDSGGRRVLTLAPTRTLIITDDSQRSFTVQFDASQVRTGDYGVRVTGVTTDTRQTILTETFPNILTVTTGNLGELRDPVWSEPEFVQGFPSVWQVRAQATLINRSPDPQTFVVDLTAVDGERVTVSDTKFLFGGARDAVVLTLTFPEDAAIGPWSQTLGASVRVGGDQEVVIAAGLPGPQFRLARSFDTGPIDGTAIA